MFPQSEVGDNYSALRFQFFCIYQHITSLDFESCLYYLGDYGRCDSTDATPVLPKKSRSTGTLRLFRPPRVGIEWLAEMSWSRSVSYAPHTKPNSQIPTLSTSLQRIADTAKLLLCTNQDSRRQRLSMSLSPNATPKVDFRAALRSRPKVLYTYTR